MEIYLDYIRPFLINPEVHKMKSFIQHGQESTFDHVLHVSYVSFILAKKLRLPLDGKSLARGGFLHDFYLYDWHVRDPLRKRFHGFHHAKTAHDNAVACFKINQVEEDIIMTHMWPMTLKLPRYKESYFVNLIDKIVSLKEIIDHKL